MSAPAGLLPSTERLAYCAAVAPDVAQVTAAYYTPEDPHPYLRSHIGGGILQREVVEDETEHFTEVSVSGLSTGRYLTSELLHKSGLPAEIPDESVLWSIVTSRTTLPASIGGAVQPNASGMVNHSWNYWDGRQWHTARNVKPERGATKQTEWARSAMLPEELVALRAVTKQIRGLHQLAEAYQGDVDQLTDDMAQLDVDPETRKWLRVAFASSLTLTREVSIAGLEQRGFMTYFHTGFQDAGPIMERLPKAKLSDKAVAAEVGPTGVALANMYRGSALIKRDSMRKRAYRARVKGRPLPLPAAW